MLAHSRRVLTSQVQPMENGVRLASLDPTDGPQAVALNQHGDSIQEYVSLSSQSLKESSCVSTKSMVTSGAVITTFSMAVDSDVVNARLPESWAVLLSAPL